LICGNPPRKELRGTYKKVMAFDLCLWLDSMCPAVYNGGMKLRTTPARYKIGEAHERLVAALRKNLSNTHVIYTETDVIRLAVEELWKRANPGKTLPKEILAFHKTYHSDGGL
jgi:hypothetical protein